MSGIFRAELIKVLRRPMTWIALGIVLAILATVQALLIVLAFLPAPEGAGGDQAGPGQLFVDLTVLPGGLANGLNFLPGLGIFALAVVGASVAGSEFSWGTVVPLFARGADRQAVVVAKILVLALVAVIWLLATIVLAFVLSAAASLIHLGRIPLDWLDLGMARELVFGVGRSLLAMLPYLAAAVALALLFRSPAIAMAVVLGYLIVEEVGLAAFTALRTVADGGLGQLIDLVNATAIGANADRLTGLNTRALSPLAQETVIEHPYRAALILVGYTILFIIIGILSLRSRDITLRPA
ncbi:ABC transporter permease [Thermomicrobiaceae bacterium CFH 74404]|uniref:ABC transporter permease n=3 Tax=Thermomicrobia TaxID=189775 RepID=A0AA41WG94_9BACT|nr:ABC transporter permease [Thermalbibacter longus]MCM8749845.1 ABC transporter permease [Thermalbibacter longus]